MTVTSGRHAQKDKERQQRIESGDIRWGLKDPESGDVAQARGRPGRDRRLTLPKSSEHRVVACAPLMMMMYLSQEKTALPQIAEKKEAVTLSPKKLGSEGPVRVKSSACRKPRRSNYIRWRRSAG